MLKQLVSFVLFMCAALVSEAVTINSSNGYTVSVNVQPVALANKQCYSDGTFNYEPELNYTVGFSQPNVSLWTLQGTMYCANNGSWFPLPTSGGTGTVRGASATYRWGNVNCSNATPASITCNNYSLIISGPGIEQQTMTVPVGNSALPVHLTSFDGRIEGNGVYLVWKTASELNNVSFTLQRSSDGSNWVDVETIAGAGTTQRAKTYEYRDRLPMSGMNYYRLEQKDADGSLSYSRIIGMRSADMLEARISPNPISGNTFRIEGLELASDWNLTIVNSASQSVYRSDLTSAQVTIPEVPSGLYFARLTNKNSGETKVIRFSK
jgi:hypothetical protein